jgi:hypothetical protein
MKRGYKTEPFFVDEARRIAVQFIVTGNQLSDDELQAIAEAVGRLHGALLMIHGKVTPVPFDATSKAAPKKPNLRLVKCDV